MINEKSNNGHVQLEGPVLKWDRIGDQYAAKEVLDLSGVVDLEALERKIEAHVAGAVVGSFAVRVELQVFLSGGPWLNLPYGYGRIDRG